MSTSGSTRSPVFRFFCASTRNSQGAASGRFGGLLPCREIGRVAGTQVVAACAFPEGAQVGADRRDVLNALFGAGGGQQRAGFGLQFQPQAGAAVATVVPFQAHDAAAGAQVGGAPGPLWLRKPGQQQRVRAKAVHG